MATPLKVSLHVGVPIVFQQPVSSVKPGQNICALSFVSLIVERKKIPIQH